MKNLLTIFIALIGFYSISQSDSTNVDSVSFDCQYKTNEVDEFTGVKKVVTISEMFVSHTDSTLMKYYKKKPHQYFELSTFTASVDGLFALYFSIRIYTKKSYDYYGSLSSGSKVILKLEDNSTIELKIAKSDFGDVDYDGGYTLYSTYFVLEDWQMQILEGLDVSKIRIYWSKGYEDYEVDNTSLLKKQFSCLH